FSTIAKSVNSIPPSNIPIGGITMSFTKEATILPNAPPIITATARSTTLPLIANSLNSFRNPISIWLMVKLFNEYFKKYATIQELALFYDILIGQKCNFHAFLYQKRELWAHFFP